MNLYIATLTTVHPESGIRVDVLGVGSSAAAVSGAYSRRLDALRQTLSNKIVRDEESFVDTAHEIEWENGCIRHLQLSQADPSMINLQFGCLS